MSMDMSMEKRICEVLAKLVPEMVEQVRCVRSGEHVFVDFMRSDSARVMETMYHAYPSYYTSSVYREKRGDVLVGDLVVPMSKKEAKIDDVLRVNCRLTDIHNYSDMGVTHIHFECPDMSKRLEELIKLLVE